ncbi:hypothetical protein [Edaphobacter albus]|uniref:hypothetical protein n=1 Tax=Edaphobacter sp. 4G125 TaxID=2763071 RepID=UPI00164707F0|nr:hypothetical protein [Edaphobacter sp. 4G125]QNI37325.1 hypothetical protein H7846_03130 [Edaphobacter sp. 4G125]
MLTEWQEIYGLVLLGFAGLLWTAWRHWMAAQTERVRERRGREEIEAYLRLDTRMNGEEDLPELARRVCAVVASRSPFWRVAMLSSDSAGRYRLMASEGMDSAIRAVAESWSNQEWRGVPVGANSMVVSLDETLRAIVVPVGRQAALLVCAESILQIPRRMAEESVIGLEALAVKLRREMEGFETRVPEAQYSVVGCLQERTCA